MIFLKILSKALIGCFTVRSILPFANAAFRNPDPRRRTPTQHQLRPAIKGRNTELSLSSRRNGLDFLYPKYDKMYIRWDREFLATPSTSSWRMQTAVTTFQKNDTKVELHAQLHFGTRDYFEYYNSRSFNGKLDTVLYELLIDESLLEPTAPDEPGFLLPTADGSSPVGASPQDQATASQYGWVCQADYVQYSLPNWFHADWTRQEFRQRVAGKAGAKDHSSSSRAAGEVPLWKLASKQSSNAPPTRFVSEMAVALLKGPPTAKFTAQEGTAFAESFSPVQSLFSILRALFWVTVPSPEMSILLLDWSSLLTDRVGGLSKISLPVLQALLAGRIDLLKQLVFGQVVVTGSRQGDRSNNEDWDLIVNQRNDRALSVLDKKMESSKRIGLLYGCSHCPDLHRKLIQRGFEVVQTEWRTAWDVTLTAGFLMPDAPQTRTHLQTLASAISIGGLYLGVGGWDWIDTFDALAKTLSTADFVGFGSTASLYIARHVLLYVTLSKVILDWDQSQLS